MPQLLEATLTQLQSYMQQGQLSAAELVGFYLSRIERFDPQLRSVIETNPQALEIAYALDQERQQQGPRGPLHGIPLLLKDNIATHDAMHTSAGSLALAHSMAPQDAFLVQRLRQAGAILLGKTNMTEWANFMTVGMKNGYSSRGGQTVNPYNPAFDTFGSSSGSGVATSANFAAAAIGTETSGSILSPSNQASLVGLKPTVGLVSRSGVVPISATQDTAGPMTRTVTDAALLLNTLAAPDPADAASQRSRGASDYTALLRPDALKGVRLGVPREVFYQRPNAAELAVIEKALQILRELGAEVIDPTNIPTAAEVFTLDYTVLLYEFRRDLNRYLAWLGPQAPVKNLKEVIRFNEAHPESCLRYGQTLMLAAQSAAGPRSPAYRYAKARDAQVAKGGLDQTFKTHRLDALLFPLYWGASIGAKPGYPSLIVPAGFTTEGAPVGLSFLGKPWSEAQLLAYGYAFEQATLARKAPAIAL